MSKIELIIGTILVLTGVVFVFIGIKKKQLNKVFKGLGTFFGGLVTVLLSFKTSKNKKLKEELSKAEFATQETEDRFENIVSISQDFKEKEHEKEHVKIDLPTDVNSRLDRFNKLPDSKG